MLVLLMICTVGVINILVKINYIVDFYNKKKEFNITCTVLVLLPGILTTKKSTM